MNYTNFINKLIALFYFLVPLGPFIQLSYGISLTPHVPILIIIFILVIYKSLIKYNKILLPFIIKYIIFIFIYIYISTIIVVSSEINYEYINQFIRILLLFAPLLLFIFLRGININTIIAGYILGNFTGVIIALTILMQGEIFYAGRLTYHSEYNPTAFGAHLAFSIILFTEFYRSQIFNNKIKGLILIALVISLILSQSRNAILALSLSVTTLLALKIFFYQKTILNKSTVKIITLSLLMCFFTLFIFWYGFKKGVISEIYFERLELVTNLNSMNLDEATANRAGAWNDYLNEPITLIGIGFTPEDYLPNGFRHNPHNIYITLLYKSGILGLLMYLGFIYLLVRTSLNNKLYFFTLTWGSLYFLLLGVGNDVMYYTYFWIPLSLWFGIYIKSKSGKSLIRLIND